MKSVTLEELEGKTRSAVAAVLKHIQPASVSEFCDYLFSNAQSRVTSLAQVGATDPRPSLQPERLMDSPHSGESSVVFEDGLRRHGGLSTDVAEDLWIDEGSLEESPNPTSVLLVANILETMDFSLFSAFSSQLSHPPKLRHVRFVFYAGSYSVLLRFASCGSAEKFRSFAGKKLPKFCHCFGDQYRLSYLAARGSPTGQKSPQARIIEGLMNYPPGPDQDVPLYSARFVGLVLLELPIGAAAADIQAFVGKQGAVPRSVRVAVFRGHATALCTFETVEEAEKACLSVNNSGALVKCFIHRCSNFYRRDPAQSPFARLFLAPSAPDEQSQILRWLSDAQSQQRAAPSKREDSAPSPERRKEPPNSNHPRSEQHYPTYRAQRAANYKDQHPSNGHRSYELRKREWFPSRSHKEPYAERPRSRRDTNNTSDSMGRSAESFGRNSGRPRAAGERLSADLLSRGDSFRDESFYKRNRRDY